MCVRRERIVGPLLVSRALEVKAYLTHNKENRRLDGCARYYWDLG